MALQQLPDMIAAGVGCFKIEGRLKGPEYVAATTAAYRSGLAVAAQLFWHCLQAAGPAMEG
jgi:collagenase-like PrtC family protease